MAGAAGALHETGHALGRADLQHPFHRQEIHPEVQARGADHGFQSAFLERQFDPVAHLLRQRAMVQGEQAGPVRARLEQRLVPAFRLRAGVGEHQCGAAGLQRLDHLRQHAQSQMPGPGKALQAGRQQAVDAQILGQLALDQAPGGHQHLKGMFKIAESGGQRPYQQRRMPQAQACEGQLQLHAALVAEQLVPLVDHHHAQVGEGLAGIGAGQQQGQAFRRGDQRTRQLAALPGAFGTTGIAGAQADVPGNLQVIQRRLQGARGIGGEGAHRGDPQHRQGRHDRFFTRARAGGLGRRGRGETLQGR